MPDKPKNVTQLCRFLKTQRGLRLVYASWAGGAVDTIREIAGVEKGEVRFKPSSFLLEKSYLNTAQLANLIQFNEDGFALLDQRQNLVLVYKYVEIMDPHPDPPQDKIASCGSEFNANGEIFHISHIDNRVHCISTDGKTSLSLRGFEFERLSGLVVLPENARLDPCPDYHPPHNQACG